MTKTAQQLWWDKEFIEKRIQEQRAEAGNLWKRFDQGLSKERMIELRDSVYYILKRLNRQLEKINQLK